MHIYSLWCCGLYRVKACQLYYKIFDENLYNENNDIFLKYLVIPKNNLNDFGKFLFFSIFVKWIFGRFFGAKFITQIQFMIIK